MEEKHLGLDISTSCTGWAITELSEGSVKSVELGHVRLDKIDGLMEKADMMRQEISRLNSKYRFTRVYVEENMQAFHPGTSSAQTIVKLAKFNGIVSYLTYQVTGLTPINVNVNHARKSLGIRLRREKECGVTTKDQIHNWAKQHALLSGYEWPYRVISSGPRKGVSVIETHAYDMSDAFVVALSGPIVTL